MVLIQLKQLYTAVQAPLVPGSREPESLYRDCGGQVNRYSLGFDAVIDETHSGARELERDLSDYLDHTAWGEIAIDVLLGLTVERSPLYVISYEFFAPGRRRFAEWTRIREGLWARRIPVGSLRELRDRLRGKRIGIHALRTRDRDFLGEML